MATSLRLPNASELAGHWQMHAQAAPEKTCALELIEQRAALAGDLACVAQWLGDSPVSWVPTPDGIWLMNREDYGIAHLNRKQDGYYQGHSESGVEVILQRAR